MVPARVDGAFGGIILALFARMRIKSTSFVGALVLTFLSSLVLNPPSASAGICDGLVSIFTGPRRPVVAEGIRTGPLAKAKWVSRRMGFTTEVRSPWGPTSILANQHYVGITTGPLPGDYNFTDQVLERLRAEAGPVERKIHYAVSFEFEGDTDQETGRYSLYLERKHFADDATYHAHATKLLRTFLEKIPNEWRRGLGALTPNPGVGSR